MLSGNTVSTLEADVTRANGRLQRFSSLSKPWPPAWSVTGPRNQQDRFHAAYFRGVEACSALGERNVGIAMGSRAATSSENDVAPRLPVALLPIEPTEPEAG